MADKKYFSLPAAARELGVSTDLLRRQYRNDLIPAIRTPGGQPRFTAETIEAIKQNGWPQKTGTANTIEAAAAPAQCLLLEETENHSWSTPGSPQNQAYFDIPTSGNAGVRPGAVAEQRNRREDPVHFRRWIDQAFLMLPDWLTQLQRAEVSRQIANEIKERTLADEPQMWSVCREIVRSVLLPLEHQHEINQARDVAVNRVLAKIPSDATENERLRARQLAHTATQYTSEQGNCQTFFDAALEAVTPIIAGVDRRRGRESLQAWALQQLPFKANEKEQREARATISRVFDQMNGQQNEMQIRDRLVEELAPIHAAISRRIDEERCLQRIEGLACSAKQHVGAYLSDLYNHGELDYEAICDWSWRRNLENFVVLELRKQLRGDETAEDLREMVEKLLDGQLEETDDDE